MYLMINCRMAFLKVQKKYNKKDKNITILYIM